VSPIVHRPESDVVTKIIASLRRVADSLERQIDVMEDQQVGPSWSEQDIIELSEAWLAVGGVIRDLARAQPDITATEPRPELIAIRDNLARVAQIIERIG
jgi:hypothetical protein